jgi:hypothetical protein
MIKLYQKIKNYSLFSSETSSLVSSTVSTTSSTTGVSSITSEATSATVSAGLTSYFSLSNFIRSNKSVHFLAFSIILLNLASLPILSLM